MTDFQERPDSTAAGTARVLVVEDDQDLGGVIQEALAFKGILSDLAFEGISALDLMERNAYAVVVTDLRLPGANGLRLAEAAMSRNCPSKVILITSCPDWSVAHSAKRVGVYRLLIKPVRLTELIDLVFGVLRVDGSEKP